MAKMKKEDINTLSIDDIKQRLVDDTAMLQKLKFNHAVNPLDNPIQIKYMRREIARLKTELRQREIATGKK
jgi:large subunit ribosomal protein L29